MPSKKKTRKEAHRAKHRRDEIAAKRRTRVYRERDERARREGLIDVPLPMPFVVESTERRAEARETGTPSLLPPDCTVAVYLRLIGLDEFDPGSQEPELTNELETLPLDSILGKDCRGAIDAARALLTHVENSTADGWPDINSDVRRILRHVLIMYIFG
jgi:hypothetical protein